jgi:hypothetical protein
MVPAAAAVSEVVVDVVLIMQAPVGWLGPGEVVLPGYYSRGWSLSFGHTTRGSIGCPSRTGVWRKPDDQLVELAAVGCPAGSLGHFAKR